MRIFICLSTEKRLAVVDVIDNETNLSSTSIQWAIPANEETQPEMIINRSIRNAEFDQGDSLSFHDQNSSVRELIEKFKNIHDIEKYSKTFLSSDEFVCVLEII